LGFTYNIKERINNKTITSVSIHEILQVEVIEDVFLSPALAGLSDEAQHHQKGLIVFCLGAALDGCSQ
jgi:hypothetical protein